MSVKAEELARAVLDKDWAAAYVLMDWMLEHDMRPTSTERKPCITCKHHVAVDQDTSRKDCNYNHVCYHPAYKELTMDWVLGKEIGSRPHCSKHNSDGTCPLHEELT